MNDHVKGILITAIGVLLVVPDSLFVRLIYAEPIVIAFWRSLTSGVFVLIIVIYFYGLSGFKDIIKTRFYGLFYGILNSQHGSRFRFGSLEYKRRKCRFYICLYASFRCNL